MSSIPKNEPAGVDRALVPFVLSVAGNTLMAGSFLRALVAPSLFTDLIFRTGPLLFLIEIWSFYGTFFAVSMAHSDLALQERGKKVFRFRGRFLVIFAVVAAALGHGFRNWFIPAFFFASLGTKIFTTKAAIRDFTRNAGRVLLSFAGTFLVAFFVAEKFYPFWQQRFPIPDEYLRYKLPNASGSIFDHPQTLLVWGACYFGLTALVEAALFFRATMISKKNTNQTLA